MNDVLNRHDKMQRLNRSTIYIYPGKKNSVFAMLTLLAVGICIGLVLMATLKACDRNAQPVAAKIASAA